MLRQLIRGEIEDEWSEIDMESQFRNPVLFTPAEVTRVPLPLRFVRRLLSDEDLAALPITLLRILPQGEGFLDQLVDPRDAEGLLRIRHPSRPGFVEAALRASREAPSKIGGGQEEAKLEIPRVPPPSPEPQIGPAKSAKSQVSEADLRGWYSDWFDRNPHSTESDVIAAATAAFPDKQFSRSRIREIRGRKKRGPKPKR